MGLSLFFFFNKFHISFNFTSSKLYNTVPSTSSIQKEEKRVSFNIYDMLEIEYIPTNKSSSILISRSLSVELIQSVKAFDKNKTKWDNQKNKELKNTSAHIVYKQHRLTAFCTSAHSL